MGVISTIGGGISQKKFQLELKKEIEKWRKRRDNRTGAVFYTAIVSVFSIYFTISENNSLFVGCIVIGICTLSFLVSLFLMKCAEAEVKKLKDKY